MTPAELDAIEATVTPGVDPNAEVLLALVAEVRRLQSERPMQIIQYTRDDAESLNAALLPLQEENQRLRTRLEASCPTTTSENS